MREKESQRGKERVKYGQKDRQNERQTDKDRKGMQRKRE